MDNRKKITMENLTIRSLFTKIDLRWILVSYCFLVLFHLAPTQFFIVQSLYGRFDSFWEFFPWIGVGIAGVGAFVAYRSQSLIILEPGIAGMLYLLTLLLSVEAPGMAPIYWAAVSHDPTYGYFYTSPGPVIALFIYSFVIGFGSAGVVTWYLLRQETKA